MLVRLNAMAGPSRGAARLGAVLAVARYGAAALRPGHRTSGQPLWLFVVNGSNAAAEDARERGRCVVIASVAGRLWL